MSAIAGIYHTDGRPADQALLRRMTDVLAHRGPDGEGQWVSGPIGLGHRLLYTTRESLHEKQPVTNERRECWLVWDGRVDNREDLIAALGVAAPAAGGLTDPELVLEAYARWGTGCVSRIIGDFAFALWDGRTRRLVCTRDPIGVKPFYYHWDGKRFLFASEVKALFADPTLVRRPNEAMIADYLLMGFRDPAETFFEGIRQLRPGHYLRLGDGELRVERYWYMDPSRELRYARDEEYLEEFRELFREAVRCRLRSSAPVGVLLSGGIDSTLVAAVAEALRRENGAAPALAAFTLLAEGFLREEWDAIGHLVETYGTEIHPVRAEARNGPVTLFELFLECSETPHHDVFLTIPHLLEPAADRRCRVLLTGFGADELSQQGEHGFLADLCRSFRLGRLARESQLRATAYGGGDWWRYVLDLLWRQLPGRLRWLMKILLNRQVPRWFDPEFAKRTRLFGRMLSGGRRRYPTWCQEETYRAVTKPEMALALNQMDANASAFSLECWHPYLDRRVIAAYLSIPSTVKLKAGYRKQFVQRALMGTVPGPIREAEDPEEHIPSMDWQTYHALEVKRIERELFHPQARIVRYVRHSEVERLTAHYRQEQAPYRSLLWRLVRLELWLQRWFPEWGVSEGGAS